MLATQLLLQNFTDSISYQIPCVRFCGALHFDPSELAAWYEERLDAHSARKPPCAEPLRGRRISIAS